MNDVKQDVIENGLTEEGEIQDAVNDAAGSLNITLTEEQMAEIVALMQTISQFDYDVNALKDTLDNLAGKGDGFFASLWESIKNFFTGGDSGAGILDETNDEILGDNAVIDSTLDSVKDAAESADGDSWWDKIVDFFKGLFGGDDEQATEEETTNDTVDDSTSDPTVDDSNSADDTVTPDSESSSDASAQEETADDGSATADDDSDASGDETTSQDTAGETISE